MDDIDFALWERRARDTTLSAQDKRWLVDHLLVREGINALRDFRARGDYLRTLSRARLIEMLGVA